MTTGRTTERSSDPGADHGADPGAAASAGPADDALPPEVVRRLGARRDPVVAWAWALAAGALAARSVVRAVRSHGEPRAVLVAGATALLAAGVVVNAYSGHVRSPETARLHLVGWGLLGPGVLARRRRRHAPPRRGRVESVRIPAPAHLGIPDRPATWVYTPPGYRPGGAPLPVVLLLHGSPGSAGDWFAGGDAAHVEDVLLDAGLVRPMILVGVGMNGRGSAGLDTAGLDSTRGGPQVATYLHEVVLPWVQERYGTSQDRRHRVLAGFSAGAFAALDQGTLRQDLYATIIAFEPYRDPGAGGRRMLASPAGRAEHDVVDRAATMHVERPLHVLLSVAGADTGRGRRVARAIAAALAARGVDVEVRTERGHQHTWWMARTGLPHALVWADRRMPPDGEPLPSSATAG